MGSISNGPFSLPTASFPGIPYFTPSHEIAPGTATKPDSSTPTLFRPLKIRSKTFKNRIFVAPMCQYSTAASGPQIGALTDYHIATLGHYALKGAALVFIEATSVTPNGRISPHCPGLWSDDQIGGVKRVADFVHSQGGLVGIQLAHAGRKASTQPPWVAGQMRLRSLRADESVGGWPEDVVGPSGGEQQSWSTDGLGYWPPKELSIQGIHDLVAAFADSAKRAVAAGVDVIEIHAAHGYLLTEFLSPITNQRTDEYGGSFENRTRMLREVITAVRGSIPRDMPLFLRVSATEWMEESEEAKKFGSWDVESTLKLAEGLPDLGIDLLDVSSGGNNQKQRIEPHSNYQVQIAGQIRKSMKARGKNLLLGAVGLITDADQAREIVEGSSIEEEAEAAKSMTESVGGKEPLADAILVARQFMREPEWVFKAAAQLKVNVAWPSQWLRVRISHKT